MTQGSNSLHFFYDASNKPAIVDFNGTKYAYVHNLQGDIVAILDSNGSVVVQYKYDAWGRIISKTGSLASTLGTVQPFRYRGYVYDEETGIYYLRSRYYSAIWQRFVNADMLLQPNFNLFSYCMQNPTYRVDPDGAAYFDQVSWDMISNRSFLSPLNIGSIAGSYQGNTAEFWSGYGTYKNAMDCEERWINSPYNVGYQSPNPNQAQNTTTLYRSVSEAEANDYSSTGILSVGAGQMEGKFFATTITDAQKWGTAFNNSDMISICVPTSALQHNSVEFFERLDAIGPAYYFSDMDYLNSILK